MLRKLVSPFGKHFIVISGAGFILKRVKGNGEKTVPYVINDLISGVWWGFFGRRD